MSKHIIKTLDEALALPIGTVMRQAYIPARWEWDPSVFNIYVRDLGWGDKNQFTEPNVEGWNHPVEGEFPFEVIAWPVGYTPPAGL